MHRGMYQTTQLIHHDLPVPKVTDQIRRFSENYLERLSHHSNDTDEIRRLKRH